MKVSAQYAQEHFADLATAAIGGEEVEIEVRGQSTLVLLKKAVSVPFLRITPRILGEGVGEMVVPEWDEWKAIDRKLELEVTNHPLIPGGSEISPRLACRHLGDLRAGQTVPTGDSAPLRFNE